MFAGPKMIFEEKCPSDNISLVLNFTTKDIILLNYGNFRTHTYLHTHVSNTAVFQAILSCKIVGEPPMNLYIMHDRIATFRNKQKKRNLPSET